MAACRSAVEEASPTTMRAPPGATARRTRTVTVQPSAMSRSATALPMPDEAPVTRQWGEDGEGSAGTDMA